MENNNQSFDMSLYSIIKFRVTQEQTKKNLSTIRFERGCCFSCVFNNMQYNEFILIGIGTAISVLGYFLKRESKRLEALEFLINKINVTLAKNEVRDSERNSSIEKRLEDRRVDVRKLYDLVQKN